MVEMSSCLLPDRGLVSVSGEDAESLLNRLFTNSILDMNPGLARYAALLSPQGKLLFDFFVFRRPEAFWIDCVREHAPDLAKRLMMFKLRSNATIEDKSAELGIAAHWDSALMEAPGPAFRDPRHNELGYRIAAPHESLRDIHADQSAYDAHRIALGIPKGGVDFVYGDTFVHDANLDLLHGVDFDKGCYVGQEVVSRVHHRKSARKRVVKVHFYGNPAPDGADLVAGTLQIGRITSQAGHDGLATARTDRLAEAEATSIPVMASETLVGITLPFASTIEAPTYGEDFY
jgi:folate-binding protein YgfZ